MREDRVACRRHEWHVEQVRLAEAKQEPGNGEHRDRQHQRAAERLQLVHPKLDHWASPSKERFNSSYASARTSTADSALSTRSSTDLQSAAGTCPTSVRTAGK